MVTRKDTSKGAAQPATLLTVLVLVLMPIATCVGLFVPGFYRDAPSIIPQARGQDLVTLVVAEPLLLVGLLAARRGFVSGTLLWIGALAYVLYTYALYSYTTYFNALFLVYVALFAVSLWALVALLTRTDTARIADAVVQRMPVRAIAGFLALVGAFFLFAWLGQIVPATLHGTVPAPIAEARMPSNPVFVQDLAVVIPLLFVSAVWLAQRRVWGYVIAAAMLILSDIIALALIAMSLFMAQARFAGALDMLPVWIVLALVSLAFTAVFAMHVHHQATQADRPTVADTGATLRAT